MLDWLRRIRKVSQKLTLPSRDATAGRSQIQLNPAKLTPSSEIQLAYLAELSSLISDLCDQDSQKAPLPTQATAQARIAADYRDRSRQLDAMLIKSGEHQMELRSDIRERLDQLVIRSEGADWHEDLMRIYVVFGILQDSAHRVSKGLAPAKRLRAEQLLETKNLGEFCFHELAAGIAADADLGPRLAMFGRMVVGDALLEIRDSVSFDKILATPKFDDRVSLSREQFKVLEPFTSELIAQHTVRMDLLGLTA
ncbi:ferritin-like fold-containing protein [Aquiluna sp.]|nr:ferritin-like fold-containing protein [Aquiluna sp.]MDA8927589.1 ferritin-like fold-containing protein [Aquiluna sp.]